MSSLRRPSLVRRAVRSAGVAAVFLFGAAGLASAAGVELRAPKLEIPIPNVVFLPPSVADGNVSVPFLAQYIAGVYKYLLGIVGALAATVMIVGGFQYVTAGGDKTRVEKGKKRIQNALIGLVLAFGSYALLWSINPGLVSFEELRLAGVKTEELDLLQEFGTDGDARQEVAVDVVAGGYRKTAWDACGSHDNMKLGSEEERRKKLVEIVKVWKTVGVDQGGSIYVRGGAFECGARPSGQVDFTANSLMSRSTPLSKVKTPICRQYLETWRTYNAMKAAEEKRRGKKFKKNDTSEFSAELKAALDAANAASAAFTLGKGGYPVSNNPDKPTAACKGASPPDECKCHREFQEEYYQVNTAPAQQSGIICGDCQTTMAYLFRCFDKTGPGYAVVTQFVPHITNKGKGKLPGCAYDPWLKKGGKTYVVNEEDFVVRLELAKLDETEYTVKVGAKDVGTIQNDPKTNDGIITELKKHLKFGDVLSIVAPGPAHDPDGARHTFMYTGGSGDPAIDYEILEMGQVGPGDKGTATPKNKQIAGITEGHVGGMAAASTVDAYFKRLGGSGGYDPLVCVWVRRPLNQGKSGFPS